MLARSKARLYLLWSTGCIVLSIALSAHSLRNGLYFDDWGLMNQARGGESHLQKRSEADELAYRTRMRDVGWMPWYGDVHARVAVFRPLPIQMHVVEFRWLQGRFAIMHAINLACWAAAIAAFAWLARRLTSSYLAAGLAVFFYALEDGHGASVEWLSGRNTIMTAAFGAVAVAAQDAWRRNGWTPGAWLCPASLALSLLCGETALCIVVYLACHALLVESASFRARLVGALPWALTTAVYLAGYGLAGYGVRGLGLYIDPLRDTGAYLASLARHAPALIVTKLLGAPSLAWPPLASQAAVLAMVAVIGAVLVPLLRRRADARFWAAGLVLAQIPAAATTPQVRLFMVTALGGSVLVAELVAHCHSNDIPGRFLRFLAYALASAAVIAHGPISALALAAPAKLDGLHDAEALDRLYAKADSALGAARSDQRVVIVNAPRPVTLGWGITLREARGEPVPLSARVLFPATGNVMIVRPDARSLVFRADRSFFGDDWPLFRGRPAVVGETAKLAGMTARVLTLTAEGGPADVAFSFDRDLEDPQLVWKQWRNGDFVDFVPPGIGEAVQVGSEAP